MHWYDGIIFEVAVHDEVRVGEPHLVIVVNGVEKFV